jgi:hypothetical protein
MRLLAGMVTETAAPPAAGVSDNDDTETSKAITLSAGASPKRTWEEVVPAAGVGVGPDAMDDPPPPQPAASAIIATSMNENTNLVTGLNECLKFCVYILYLSWRGPS